MNGLIVLGTTVGGGIVGCCIGFVAAMFWADMDIGSLDALGYIGVGTAGGAAVGAYIGGEILS